MDQNEITMAMDVKMDLKEKKCEYFQLRTWTKCIVTIEAVKYIPCFVKITLIRNTNDQKSNIVIKIHIPGISVQLAESRSKAYSYGLFWTQHRKNCRIFFGLDSMLNLERHIKWIQNSITNLELHRREMLEIRRASRIGKIDESVSRSLDTSVDSNVPNANDTQDIRDINDILGPLPKVPDSNLNWSRRISGVSEIYEEIAEGDAVNRNLNRMLSRTSIASGIYEVMTLPLGAIDETCQDIDESPPPLPPPRPRVYTQTEMNRAYTNPESITTKKRKKNIFETVFSRHKSLKRKSPKPKELLPKRVLPATDLISSHRMSYSTPDLSNVDVIHYANEFEGDLLARSSVTEFSIRNEHSFLNSTTSSTSDIPFNDECNISENILSTFNISCNDSVVNLVGSKLNVPTPTVATIIDDVSGYCRMAPIIRYDVPKSPVLVSPQDPLKSVTNQNQQFIRNNVKTINFRRNYGVEASIQNFENLTISKESSCCSTKDASKGTVSVSTESSSTTKSSSTTGLIETPTVFSESPKLNTHNDSFDEKYPSYYPNEFQQISSKISRKENVINYISKRGSVPVRKENVYIASPRHRTTIACHTPSKSSNISSPVSSETPPHSSTFLTPSVKPMPTNVASASASLYQKYSNVSPTSAANKGSYKKIGEINNSMKRFTSMPLFKKIDFSPLKLKINNVLHRQNPDQM